MALYRLSDMVCMRRKALVYDKKENIDGFRDPLNDCKQRGGNFVCPCDEFIG